MDQADLIRFRHMRDAAAEALQFAAGKTRADLDHDRMLILAILKDLEIIGEAASRVSRETKEQYSSIPWDEIVGMRNRLIHGYFDVNLDVVWETISHDLTRQASNYSLQLDHSSYGTMVCSASTKCFLWCGTTQILDAGSRYEVREVFTETVTALGMDPLSPRATPLSQFHPYRYEHMSRLRIPGCITKRIE